MSNSPLVTYTKMSPNIYGKRTHKIDTVTPHCVVGQMTVEDMGAMFARKSYGCSPNYGIGTDGRIALFVPEDTASICSSSRANDERAVTIECASDSRHPYAVNAEVYRSLVCLLADICHRNAIPSLLWRGDKSLIGKVNLQNITVHRWFHNKACPGEYIYARLGQIAAEVNDKLEDQQMTQDKFNEMFKVALSSYRSSLQDNDASKYSEAARNWAVEQGLIRGSGGKDFNAMWEDFVTREQMVTMLYRVKEISFQVQST